MILLLNFSANLGEQLRLSLFRWFSFYKLDLKEG